MALIIPVHTSVQVSIAPMLNMVRFTEVVLSLGSGEYLLWEHPLSFWLEQKGYHVSYCSNLDTERDPGVLDRAKVFLSVGHDEYWTRPTVYENVKAARDRGLSLAFLSGNAVMRQLVTYKSTVTGAPLRAFARLKEFEDEHLLMGGCILWGLVMVTG